MNQEVSERNHLEMLQSVDIQRVDKNSLVDIRSVKIDETMPVEQRVRDFLIQIKNPYCFKVGKVAVKVEFSGSDQSFEDNFERMLMVL